MIDYVTMYMHIDDNVIYVKSKDDYFIENIIYEHLPFIYYCEIDGYDIHCYEYRLYLGTKRYVSYYYNEILYIKVTNYSDLNTMIDILNKYRINYGYNYDYILR